MHDVIEDTPVTFVMLHDLGYSDDVLQVVNLLTRRKSMTHRLYLQTMIDYGNVSAMRVKLADMYDNSWVSRLPSDRPDLRKDLEKMIEQRYKPSIALLRGVLGSEADGIIEGDLP